MKPVTWSDHPFEPNEIPIPATIGQHQKLGKDSPYQIPLAHLREKFVDSAWSRRLDLSLRQLTLSSSSSVPHSCEEPHSRQTREAVPSTSMLRLRGAPRHAGEGPKSGNSSPPTGVATGYHRTFVHRHLAGLQPARLKVIASPPAVSVEYACELSP
ncbi:hypothetical protein Bbelb_436680 [Branchiostoma belcheri]|nr:hypothetical protein Bbelb_436680 [Branchiostoma belcheri]